MVTDYLLAVEINAGNTHFQARYTGEDIENLADLLDAVKWIHTHIVLLQKADEGVHKP